MKRKNFSKSFKQEVVRQLKKGDQSATVLARELGLRRNQLYKWQRQVELKGEAAFSGADQLIGVGSSAILRWLGGDGSKRDRYVEGLDKAG